MITADADIKITHNPPPKPLCKLCSRTITSPFGEMFLVLFDTPDTVVEKHQGIKICYDCYNKLLSEIGMSI